MIRLVILFFFMACSSPEEKSEIQNDSNTINISGTVGYPQQGIILLEKIKNNQAVPYDTLTLNEKNQFNQQVAIDAPGYYRLNFYNKQFVLLILEDDDIRVDVDGNSRNGFARVSGSDAHDLINKVQAKQQEFQQSPAMEQLNQDFAQASGAGNIQKQEELRDQYLEMEAELNQDIINLMDSAGTTLAVVDLLSSGQFLDKDKYFAFYDRKSQEFHEELPQNERVQAFVDQVEKMRVTAIGEIAPEIALPNPEGDTVKLSSLRGKYVLVDFWAKWCRPCRMENPNVVRMYNKYKDHGFEVYGVSLDKNKADWIQAIQEDKLFWTQVSDLKFWNSEAAKTYGINAIPFAVLLDPEGKIIAKNLRGKQLENKLSEIFGE